MRGVNKVILVGNLGHDVEVRQMTNGNPVANIRIATNERWTRRETGQVQEHTEWHNVVLFGRRAELAQQFLQKGSRIYVEGRLRTRSWQDREGQERRSTEVVADDMQFLDRRGGDGDYDQQRGSGGSGGGGGGGGGGGESNAAQKSNYGNADDGDMDDEVPF